MSAGGIAVNSWTNYVKDVVGDDSKVYSISDSGVFINFESQAGEQLIQKETQNIVAVANIDEAPPAK